MKLIVTGSLGNIGEPLTRNLVAGGHTVTVISSSPDKKQAIDALGATAAIGSLEDADFLTRTFRGADAVYCMIPPNHFGEQSIIGYYRRIAGNYGTAIKASGVKRVIHLSTYGADLDQGTGLILGSHNAEQLFNALPGIVLTHMRPTYFYYNFNLFIEQIRHQGVMKANYGGDPIVMVSPKDIAVAVAEELTRPATANSVRYVASDEATGKEVAAVLGTAIGKPDLTWELISDEELMKAYASHGVPQHVATGLTEMFASLREGRMAADYHRHEPPVKGKVKLSDFAIDFAAAYNKK